MPEYGETIRRIEQAVVFGDGGTIRRALVEFRKEVLMEAYLVLDFALPPGESRAEALAAIQDLVPLWPPPPRINL